MVLASAHYTERLELATALGFSSPGAGRARRLRLAEHAQGYLEQVWQEAISAAGFSSGTTDVALAVVGSQARGEAGPLSDVDLVLVHTGRVGAERLSRLADGLWYPLWDAGVRFDHSVRTLAECRKAASGDLAAAVGMLDLAPVAGDATLVAGVRQSVGVDWRAAARKRLPEVLESLEARHASFAAVSGTLEPDLKESGGGLRDLLLIDALTTAWLADPQRGALDPARTTLLDVRDALQVVTERGRATLGLQHQDAVAQLLGLQDADELLTRVVDAGRAVAHVRDTAVRSASQAQRARGLRVGPRRPRLTPLGYGLFLHDEEVVLGGSPREPGVVQLLRAATQAARRGMRIAPATAVKLASDLPRLPTPWPAPVREAFVELLASGAGLVDVWEDLDRIGVIDAWFPEWASIRSRPQRNALHRFTVDRHLIEACAACEPLLVRVARPDLLVVAAFLHDIGKVPGQRDHSVEGAPVARAICERMGFDANDAAVVERLVRHHLTLAECATRRDPDDPRTADVVIEAVSGQEQVLQLLAALTEADAVATGTGAWTSWRAGLVADLVRRAEAQLTHEVATSNPWVGWEPTAQDAQRVRDGDVVLQVERKDVRSAVLTVVDVDRPGLFADTAGLLALRRLRVVAAAITTREGLALDRWSVEAPHGELPDVTELERALRALRCGDRTPLRALDVPARRAHAGSERPSDVLVRRVSSAEDAQRIEVRAPDRVGLLFDVGRALAACGVALVGASVMTSAGRAVDVFTVRAADAGTLDPHALDRALDAVRGALRSR